MWTRGGGGCRFFARRWDSTLEPFGFGAQCTNPAHPPHLWSTVRGAGGVSLLEGYAPGAARVRIGGGIHDMGGGIHDMPLGWFVAEFDHAVPITAYDSSGRVIGRAPAGSG